MLTKILTNWGAFFIIVRAILLGQLNTSKRDSKQRRTCAFDQVCVTDQDSHPKYSWEQCIPWDSHHKNHTFVSAGFCAAAQHSKSLGRFRYVGNASANG